MESLTELQCVGTVIDLDKGQKISDDGLEIWRGIRAKSKPVTETMILGIVGDDG